MHHCRKSEGLLTFSKAMPKILIVEDVEDLRFLLRTALKSEGVELAEAENAAEAIRLAREFRPDLILLDFRRRHLQLMLELFLNLLGDRLGDVVDQREQVIVPHSLHHFCLVGSLGDRLQRAQVFTGLYHWHAPSPHSRLR